MNFQDTQKYKNDVLQTMLEAIKPLDTVLAAWQGGSVATATADQYSDIDLCVLAQGSLNDVLNTIEKALGGYGVDHTWQVAKNPWGEGLMQRILVLKNSPKHFFIDVGVFDHAHPKLMESFLEIERHGNPQILFDKVGAVQLRHTDAKALFDKQKIRIEELNNGLSIYKTLVLKEIARGNQIDALAFFQSGFLRPLIEVLGMLHRPYKYDFGMRYIHRHFPKEDQKLIEELSYISNVKDLCAKMEKAEIACKKAVDIARKKKSINDSVETLR